MMSLFESEGLVVNLKKKENFKVLIVEDDDMSYFLLKEILEIKGIKFERAYNGKEAVDYFFENDSAFDLVLMDIRLPELNGIKATKLIKSLNPEIPIVAITAYAHSQCIFDCYDSGCDGYVAKPYNLNKITSIVDSYILKN